MSSSSSFTPIALTALFTPQPVCFSTVSNVGGAWPVAFLPGSELEKICFAGGSPIGNDENVVGYFSPGRCPSNYVPLTISPTATITGEYAFACCPSGFTVGPGSTSIPRKNTSPRRGCETVQHGGALTYLTIDGYFSGYTNVVHLTGSWTIQAYSIQIRFKQSDISLFRFSTSDSSDYGLHPTSAGAPFVVTSRLTPPSPSLDYSPSDINGTPSKLSEGTKIAIGVLIPLAVIALTVGVFLYFRQRNTLKRLEMVEAQIHHHSTPFAPITPTTTSGPTSINRQPPNDSAGTPPLDPRQATDTA